MDIVEILKLGLPGLVFLLALLSYRLLAKEQQKDKPDRTILKYIKSYMYVNILLAILTASAPFLESTRTAGEEKCFIVEARLSESDLASGHAAVCSNAPYSSRYLLIHDENTAKIIQVYALGVLPCVDDTFLFLNHADAANLGWTDDVNSGMVLVNAAEVGQMYSLVTVMQ